MKGPSRKEETPQKFGNRNDHEQKVSKAKRVLSTSIVTKTTPSTYDEAKAFCKARKRKERQESISSLCQDRKVIRSNSEERPNQKKHIESKQNIRRVSSSEDFQKSSFTHEKLGASPSKLVTNEKSLVYDDCEHEKRRSHERFSKPLTLKNKRNHQHKKFKARYVSRTKFKPEISHESCKDSVKKIPHPEDQVSEIQSTSQTEQTENTDGIESKLANFLQLHNTDTERSPSPINTPISPTLDLSTLHQQVDCSEPLLSCAVLKLNENTETLPSISVASNRLLSSPRNSIIATHRIYLDRDVPHNNTLLEDKPQNPVDERLQKLNKQINSVKKKIKKNESEFESKNGYKPSHYDKLNDRDIKKLYGELSKLRKEHKQLTDVSGNCSLTYPLENHDENQNSSKKNLKDTITEIEKKLSIKREASSRSSNVEEMTPDQLLEEKVAIQKALLYLESVHGRPNSRDDRDLVRPFYDRYRNLKRLVAKLSAANLSGIELATIHENETMNFITTTPSQPPDTELEKNSIPSNSTDSDTDSISSSENLHSLSKSEQVELLKLITEEKKELKRRIREFESDTQIRTGKMIHKENKGCMEAVYLSYKKVKAKLKLLEALVGKQV